MASENSTVSSAASARAVRDIAREIRAMLQSPPEGIRLLLSGDDADCISVVHSEIDGPVGTPYEGGVFRMKLEFGSDFPNQPPKGYFLTRIFHPNIAKNGEICVNTLKRDWKPSLGLRHILIVIRCLLIEPYPESALNEEAGKLLLDDYAEYAHHARLMTSIHALPRHVHLSASSTPAQEHPSNKVPQGKDKARSPASGNEPAHTRGSPGENSGQAVAPSPLALNSSIVNSEADGSCSAGRSGTGGPSSGTAHLGHQGHLQEQGEGGGGSGMTKGGQGTGGGREKAEKKKQDVRKKALKRL